MSSRYFAKNAQERTRTFDPQGRIGRGGNLTFVEFLIANRENLIKLGYSPIVGQNVKIMN